MPKNLQSVICIRNLFKTKNRALNLYLFRLQTYLFNKKILFLLQEKESLKNEANMLKELNHVNIVKCYHAINKADGIYIFFEYVSRVFKKKLTKNVYLVKIEEP